MRLTHRVVRLPLAEPFVSHRGVATHVTSLLVELDWQGLRGVGAGLLATPAALAGWPAQAAAAARVLAGADPFSRRELWAELDPAFLGSPSPRAAVDTALHDLLARAAGLPLHHLLGLRGRSLPASAVTLGAGSEDDLLARVGAVADWPIVKVKVSDAVGLDAVRRVRSVYAGQLWVDGNGRWSPADAVRAAGVCAELGVSVLEQPVAPGDPAALRYVHERSPVPVIADEDVRDARDVPRLAGCVSGVNVKLHKAGGLDAAMDTICVARAHGLSVLLGCKTESVVGVTAIAQLAGLADALDLDGAMDIQGDPYAGLVLDRGRVRLPDLPGIGVTPVPAPTATSPAPSLTADPEAVPR